MLDMTRLIDKISPDPDGEPNLSLRTMTVDAVNPDGTVDLVTSGTIVPNVAVLENALVVAGDHVQVLTGRGTALVLGVTASGNPSEVAGGVTITPTANTPTAQTVTYPSLGGTGTIIGFATPFSSVPGSTVIETSVSSVGATSTNVYLYRTNTVSTTVHYLIRRATQ